MKKKIIAVVPAYKCKDKILSTVETMPKLVDWVIVVDDCCPVDTCGALKGSKSKKFEIIRNAVNMGVGGAVQNGFKRALDLGGDIIVKMDGDGQMDPAYLESLVRPILEGKADYAKGNRFKDLSSLKSMPKARLFGNSALSFMVKAASGYWNIMDPTNGYVAIEREALLKLDYSKLAKRYFFEFDMLINLNIENAVVVDVPMPAKYGDEKSSLKISRILIDYPWRILKGSVRRWLLKYYLYDFNMASVYVALGLPLTLFGIVFSIVRWVVGAMTNTANTAGTVMLAVLPIVLGLQFLLQATQIDIQSVPKKD